MSKVLPDKSRAALVSRVRKSAMMGAAATALIAVAPAFADAQATEASLQSAIRNILRTPAKETTWRASVRAASSTQPRFSAIDIANGDDITVGADEAAISHAETVEDVNVVNTGNLTGGVGIEVSSGAINLADSITDVIGGGVNPGIYKYIYDDAGNVVSTGTATAEITLSYRDTVLNTDPLASRISIDNSGSVDFSGREGISASNKTGESITIENSGDIASTQDTEGRVGIYATTESYRNVFVETLIDPGEFTYNAAGQLTGVVEPAKWNVDVQRVDMPYDGGTIKIHNTGDIDMGDVGALATFEEMHAAGIYAKGDGGTTIDNEGDIRIGRGSFGIRTVSQGNVTVANSGRIDMGNASAGISVWRSNGNAGNYRLSGDTYILNTGDVVGGVTIDELEAGEAAKAIGIHVVVPGSTNEYVSGIAHWNLLAAEYNEILGYNAFTIYDVPNLELFDTTTINRGHIELKDGGVGIAVIPLGGFSTAINEGTIIVGDGTPDTEQVNAAPSVGVYQGNLPHNAAAVMTSINGETGIIVTGDDSIGVGNENYAGDSFVINEGSITTGNGVVGPQTEYGETYDLLFTTKGLFSRSFSASLGTTAYAFNSGSITVGDLAIGSEAVGNGQTLLDPTRLTAININEGVITAGDNSIGMSSSGRNTLVVNTGTITTGDFDISAYHGGKYTQGVFEHQQAGASASAWRYAQLINDGTITVGDGKIGAVARSANSGIGYTAILQQGETGVITTGDHAIGARVHGNLFSFLGNAGEISVGGGSTGVEMTSGDAFVYIGDTQPTAFPGVVQAFNSGIIETGDNSTGIQMNGFREDVPWSFYVYKPDPVVPYSYYRVDYSGTVDVTGTSYLQNSGTIRVGANSNGVVITGTGGNEQGQQLFNLGTIDGSVAGSSALSINAGLNIDSQAVNVGTIAGSISFGAGDDKLTNTLMIDNAGRITHSGNIILNGSTIDFGAGNNSFENDRGTMTIAGGNNLITGADVVMTAGNIEARNNAVDSSLTIDGNLSGDFTFGTDVNAGGADQLIITGDVANDSTMSVVINATEQLSGASSFKVITVGGENNGNAVVAGVTGDFADSLLNAEVNYSEATGEVTVTANFGMGHMATSASAATGMAQHWWMQSIGSLDKRDMLQIVGQQDAGISTWASIFQEEGSVDPSNVLQDVSFDQKLSGLQAGIEWKGDVGSGTFNVGPMFNFGNASSSQNANLANAKGDASAYGLTAGYRFKNGLYVNAAWQQMAMDIDFHTPGTLSNAIGSTDAEGDGFDVELGYAHKLGSGLTLAPQLQYASVSVDLDDFTSSDDVYALTELGGKHSLLRAGLSLFKTFETTNGSITPLVDVSYLDVMDGDSGLTSNGIAFGNDSSGSGYRAEFGVAGRYKGWDVAGRVGLANTAAIKSALSSNLTVRYHW